MDNIDPQERHDRLQGKLHDDVVDALDLEEEYLTDEHSDKDKQRSKSYDLRATSSELS